MMMSTVLRAPDDGAGAGGAAAGADGKPSGQEISQQPTGSPGTEAKFWDGYADDLKTSHSVTKFKTAEELARSYVALEKARGVPPERLLTLPEDMTNPEGLAPIYRALGCPDAPEGYGVVTPETAPDVVKSFLGELPKEMHAVGATKAQVEKFVGLVNKFTETQLQTETDANTAAQKQVDDWLKSEYGDQAEDARKQVINLLKDAAGDQFPALQEELAGKMGTSPILFKALMGLVNARREGGLGEKGDGKGGGFEKIMGASDAQAAKNAFFADPNKVAAWKDASHPQHKTALAEMDTINRAIVNARKASKK